MASSSEAGMAALYTISKNMVPLRNTLIEMNWPQTESPIQKYNLTAVGFTTKTIVNKVIKSKKMKLK